MQPRRTASPCTTRARNSVHACAAWISPQKRAPTYTSSTRALVRVLLHRESSSGGWSVIIGECRIGKPRETSNRATTHGDASRNRWIDKTLKATRTRSNRASEGRRSDKRQEWMRAVPNGSSDPETRNLKKVSWHHQPPDESINRRRENHGHRAPTQRRIRPSMGRGLRAASTDASMLRPR